MKKKITAAILSLAALAAAVIPVYAEKEPLRGDFWPDGNISVSDALEMARYVVGWTQTPYDPYDWDFENGDMNQDGKITILDAILFAETYYPNGLPPVVYPTPTNLSIT